MAKHFCNHFVEQYLDYRLEILIKGTSFQVCAKTESKRVRLVLLVGLITHIKETGRRKHIDLPIAKSTKRQGKAAWHRHEDLEGCFFNYQGSPNCRITKTEEIKAKIGDGEGGIGWDGMG